MNNKPIYVTFGDKKIENEFEILKHRNSTISMSGGFVNSTTNLIVEFRVDQKPRITSTVSKHATSL